ncbi:hypothetical protein ACQPTN_29770 [Bradyrhizobium sp. 13971]
MFTGSAGLRLERLYWNPDSDLGGVSAMVSPVAHSCERAQVSGKQRYSRGFDACNPAISRKWAFGRTESRDACLQLTRCDAADHRLTSGVHFSAIAQSARFMFSRLLFFVALLLIPGVLRAEETPVQKAGFAKKLTIYLAKGPANACGAGCDRWIAIEGEIDREAAQRIRTFLFRSRTGSFRSTFIRRAETSSSPMGSRGSCARTRPSPGSAVPSCRPVPQARRSTPPA